MNPTSGTRLGPLALQILRYLATHPNPQDTLEGIASWWLLEQRTASATAETTKALADLVAAKLVAEQRGRDGSPHFRLNPRTLRGAASLLARSKPAKTLTRVVARRPSKTLVLPRLVVAALERLKDQIALRQRSRKNSKLRPKPRTGFTCLFCGPPGPGKTLAAELLARMCRSDLYRVDLASVVSKYIGETEKNLSRIFGQAERAGTILFFDEADALFGKHTDVHDAHDRYANLDTNYLLQRIEAFQGVAILTTNLKSNIAPAFLRRLHAIVRIPVPQPRPVRRSRTTKPPRK